MSDEKAVETDDAKFKRVVDYFLDHEKPKDEPALKRGKAKPKAPKKPSTKSRKRP